ncbi:MAG: alpha/beta fold hydrolase, partial [Rubripirellula sp.]
MNSTSVRTRKTLAFWGCLMLIAMMFALTASVLPFAPDRIPIHWNLAGQADGTSPSLPGLLAIPVVTICVLVLLVAIPRFDPARDNYVSFGVVYWRIALAIMLFLAGVHALICASAVGKVVAMSFALPLMLGALMCVMGNYLGKLRPNWMIGIRTPWTLSSKRSWDRTHRVGGWLFIAMSFAVASLAWLSSPAALITVGIGCTLCLIFLVVFSWWIWRQDPDKIAASNVKPSNLSDSASTSAHCDLKPLLMICVTALLATCSADCRAESPTTSSLKLATSDGNLFGTIDLPAVQRVPVPVVLILPGSGPTDADGNSPSVKNDSLKLLGNGLAQMGIAACRIDKRGVGRSQPAGVSEADLRFETYVVDAERWINFLKQDKRFSGVHLIGHSEGALVGLLAAAQTPVASYTSIAGTGRKASNLLREQLKPKLPAESMKIVETSLRKLESGERFDDVPAEWMMLFRPSVQPYLISWFRHDPV